MNGEKRRTEIIGILKDTDRPVSGGNLAEKFNISRQVIVQDIALLRAQGYDILSANRGYMIQKNMETASRGDELSRRVFKVIHKAEDTEKELNIFADFGYFHISQSLWEDNCTFGDFFPS